MLWKHLGFFFFDIAAVYIILSEPSEYTMLGGLGPGPMLVNLPSGHFL